MNSKVFALLGTLLTGVMLVQSAFGSSYPDKPVEIIIPFTPGSPTDIMSRLVADIMPRYFPQPMIAVNKPGAGGSLAAAVIVSSKPDGYKILCAVGDFFGNTVKTQKIPFDSNQITPLANFVEFVGGFYVKADSPWKTFNDLIDYAKKNPGKMRWAHSGRGIRNHIMGTLIFRKAGVEAIDVPYKGTPESLSALLGGHVEAATMPYSAVMDQVKAGKIRFLVALSDHRYASLPDIPSLAEVGFPEAAKLTGYAGFYIHRDTPEEIKRILFNALKKVYDDPSFKRRVEELGDEPRFGDEKFLRESIKRTEEIVVPVLKELGLYVGK